MKIALRLILPLLFLAGGYASMKMLWVKKEEKSQEGRRYRGNKPKVRAVELRRTDFGVTITSQGVARAHNSTSLTPRVSGRVYQIAPDFESGAFFKKGDVLLELDPTDYDAALAAAEARLARADAALAQEIARGRQARLDWDDLKYEGEPSPLVLREPQKKEALANQKAAQADLLQAQRDLERCQVLAPYDGCVLERLVGLGQSVNSGTSLGQIFSTDHAEIRLPLSAPDLPYFDLPEEKNDTAIHATLFDALDLESGKTWKGRVIRTEGALADASRELYVVCRVEDPYGLQSEQSTLRIGQPVRAEIEGRMLKNVFVLPRSSLRGPNEVIIVNPDDFTIERTEINPIWSDPDQVVVRDELPEGSLLVTSSLAYAANGSEVEIIDEEEEKIKAAQKLEEAAGDQTKSSRAGGAKKKGA